MVRGCYRFATYGADVNGTGKPITLMGSGAILTEVLKAAKVLAGPEHGFAVEVLSVTSWSELARDGATAHQAEHATGTPEPGAESHPDNETGRLPFITHQLITGLGDGPVIAATDYVRAVPEAIRAYVPDGRSFRTLGTDGFGRSDTRAALREFFGVDAAAIVRAALAL